MLEAWLASAVGTVWNYPVVGLCLFCGIFFTLRLAFIQLRCFPHALALVSGKYDDPNETGSITHFQALSAALSGTVGLGNIAGVAIAIATGGPGAVFWMWVIGFIGMATKYAECALGTMYRKKDPATGKIHGGPMYYITEGLGKRWKPMAIFFALCCAIGSFGFANMFQSNQVAIALSRYYNVPDWMTGLLLAALVGLTIIGGIKRIGAVASKIVPLMCGIYLIAALYICLSNIELIPYAHWIILSDAFTGHAAAGGLFGSVVIIGVRRAVFSNEAGLGSAPIAHAAVKTNYPIREGVVASLGPLIDTIVICTATAMAIILSGNFGSEMYEQTYAASLTQAEHSEFILTGDWSVSGEDLPPEVAPLRDFREGDAALVLAAAGKGGVAITPPLKMIRGARGLAKKSLQNGGAKIADGVRFSCLHNGGHRDVKLVDRDGAEVVSLKVAPDGDSFSRIDPTTGEEVALASINGCSEAGDWHSHVISFTPAMQELIKAKGSNLQRLHMRFSAGTGTPTWYLDRFQTVKALNGVELTTVSFDKFLKGWAGILISLGVLFFCYSTMITWSYYGATALGYVFGEGIVLPYRLLFCATAFLGAIVKLDIVLNFSDLMSGLMVIPNTVASLMLSPIVVSETKSYFARLKAGEFEPKSTDVSEPATATD